MARFYRNLLGKREGLKAPMPKAEALAEAKRWLRGAGPAEVGAALAALPRGEIVRREAVKATSSAHPYEDPTYWAGFVLVGAARLKEQEIADRRSDVRPDSRIPTR